MKYRLGIVVGKFAPLHRGHEWLIRQMATQCEGLMILSYSKPEHPNCGVIQRKRWFGHLFPEHEVIVLDDHLIKENCRAGKLAFRPLPENSATDFEHQSYLAWLLHEVLERRPDAIFCSERYGIPTAEVLSQVFGKPVCCNIVDLARQNIPISATRLREDPSLHRTWLAEVVRASFPRRIAILGGESSGKSTLAQALAATLNTPWVPEFGRVLWERKGGQLIETDLLTIAHEQIRTENAAYWKASKHLFCDTTPLTTLFYSLSMFGRAVPELVQLAQRHYDLIVLCEPDFPFVQDGTRRDDGFRSLQHHWYQEQLASATCPVILVTGSLAARVQQVSGVLLNR